MSLKVNILLYSFKGSMYRNPKNLLVRMQVFLERANEKV